MSKTIKTEDIRKIVVDCIIGSDKTISEISRQSGIPVGTIKGWVYHGKTPSVENAQFVLALFNKELCIKEISEDGE